MSVTLTIRSGFMTRWTTTAGILGMALAATSCGTGQAEETSSLQTTAVERGNLRITAEATGTVEPVRMVEVKSKASGEVLRLHVDVGDVVEPGALLAEVDPRDVRNRLDQTAADLELAQSRLDITEARLRRSEELHEAGAITEQELENARLDYSNARADMVRARTNEGLARLQLGDVTIRAPMAGTILQKSVEEGQVIQSASQNVSGGTTLFVMASLVRMQVRTLVDETDVGEVQAGMPTQVRVEAYPDRVFRGVVEKVEPLAVVEQNVTMFPVIVELDNRDGFLRPGMNAEVEILIDEATDVLLVPNNAVVMPRDAGPAALAVGLELDDIDLSTLARGGFGGRLGAGPGGAASGGARSDSVRARVARGEVSRDSARALAGARRDGSGPPGTEARTDGESAGPVGESAGDDGAGTARLTRRAVVFTVNAEGVPTPIPVEIGLNDWDRTQIVSGVEEGDPVALIGAARLQAQQQEFLNRIRERRSGPFGG